MPRKKTLSLEDGIKPELAQSALEKVEVARRAKKIVVTLLTFARLRRLLSPKERRVVDLILKIHPNKNGLGYDYVGLRPPPKDLVRVRYRGGKNKRDSTLPVYLPKNSWQAVQLMNRAMRRDIGKTVQVVSGYRSPAYQAIVFLWNLRRYKYDLRKTLRLVALPGYSEHGDPENQGIDFAVSAGGAPFEEFEKTKEYAWMRKNAWRFGFELSYPRNNSLGVQFEPWHWRFTK